MKFLALWEHRNTSGQAGDVSELIKEDLRKGIFKEWGAFASFGKGFVILDVENEARAFAETMKYNKYGVVWTSADPFLTFDEVVKVYQSDSSN